MNQIEQTNQWMNNREAANHLGFSPATLGNSRYTGLLGGVSTPRFRKLGKSIRYERKVLDDWLSQFKEQTSTSDSVA